jgi:hypothetical protein
LSRRCRPAVFICVALRGGLETSRSTPDIQKTATRGRWLSLEISTMASLTVSRLPDY